MVKNMSVYDKIKELLVNEFKIDEAKIRPEAKRVTDLGLNSLELAELILTCEERFGIVMHDNDLKRMVCVSDIAAYLSSCPG